MADAAAREIGDDAMRIGMKRAGEMAAVFMIGDGAPGLLQPRRNVDLWRSPVAAVDVLVRPFAGRPARRRWYGVAQIVAGLALAAALRGRPGSERNGDPTPPSRSSRGTDRPVARPYP